MGEAAIRPSDKDRGDALEHYRSVCTRAPESADEMFTVENLGGKRPGTGIPTERFEDLRGRKAALDLSPDTWLAESDVL